MARNRKNDEVAKRLLEHLKTNPESSYEEMQTVCGPQVKVNSVIVKLLRAGCIEAIKRKDESGRIISSYKKFIKDVEW